MKTVFLKYLIPGLFAFSGMLACNSPEGKIESAKEDVLEANKKLEQARLDSIKHVEYVAELELKLQEYDSRLDEMKDGFTSMGKDIRASYDQNVLVLKEKNEKLRVKLREYKGDAENSWDSFVFLVNKEIEELGNSISEMAKKNMNENKKK